MKPFSQTLLLLLLAVGCFFTTLALVRQTKRLDGLIQRVEKLEPPTVEPAVEKIPPFEGKPADKPVGFDLVGTWNVMRYETPEKPSKQQSRWECQWNLKKVGNSRWEDERGADWKWRLTKGVPQFLVWTNKTGDHYFSINEQRFGLLMMTWDDEFYMAVRTDGGETIKE